MVVPPDQPLSRRAIRRAQQQAQQQHDEANDYEYEEYDGQRDADGKYTGHGVLTKQIARKVKNRDIWPDNRQLAHIYKYEGNFLNGKYHGQGTLVVTAYGINDSSKTYEGEWSEGNLPRGKYIEKEKDYLNAHYEGPFVDLEPDGINGRCTYYHPIRGNAEYYGSWEKGIYHGWGRLTHPNGNIDEKMWSEGY
jgi:hypothetical protein